MSDRFFLDTNIFAYSFDHRDVAKQRKAQALIGRALSDNSGLISFQVVQEFLNVALRKFERPLSIQEAKSYLEQVLNPLCEIFSSVELYRRALDIQAEAEFGFYDSLIIASALHGGCKTLYSEDFQSGQRIVGLAIQDPF